MASIAVAVSIAAIAGLVAWDQIPIRIAPLSPQPNRADTEDRVQPIRADWLNVPSRSRELNGWSVEQPNDGTLLDGIGHSRLPIAAPTSDRQLIYEPVDWVERRNDP